MSTSTDRTVVVGIKSSGSSHTALQHAAAAALERRLSLTVLHSFAMPALMDGSAWLLASATREVEAAVLQEALEKLEETSPGCRVLPQLVEREAAGALVEASEAAELLIVGRARHHRAWLGPVLSHLSSEAGCPVLCVPDGHPVRHGDVVVGVDGSEVSAQAVGYAFEQADRWRTPLVAVLSLHGGFDAYVPSAAMLDQMHERGARELSESLAGWSQKYPDVPVHQLVTFTEPIAALAEAARDAGVLVVGSNGRGAISRAFVGSVSSSLLRDAPCPLAVVRPSR